ncbi:unnamed protein product, partial [Chrysoparadoxa australica]
MQEQGIDAHSMARKKVEAAASTLQRLCLRMVSGGVMMLMRKQKHLRELTALQHASAIVMQNAVRHFLARRQVVRLAFASFLKCIDPVTGSTYYFNTVSGQSSWAKPSCLGSEDIASVIRMPLGSQIVTVICSYCEIAAASQYCIECSDSYCDNCNKTLHGSGNSATHTRIPIEHCVECSFQVATKRCLQCKDIFCDSCYNYVHMKGRLQLHKWEAMVGMCHECHNSAYMQQCFGCPDGGHMCLCAPCQAKKHEGIEGALALDSHKVQSIAYFPLSVTALLEEFQEKLERER